MTQLAQAKVQWTGFGGGPGVSTFYFKGSDGVSLSMLRTFFEAIKTSIPSTVTIKYPGFGNLLEDASGDTVGTWSAAAPADTVGTSGGTYCGLVGTVVTWHTAVYTGGRELKGRTFLVPLGSICFAGDGRLAAATQTAIKTAADGLHPGTGGIQIYSPTQHTSAPALTAKIPLTPCYMTSRRPTG